MPFRIRPTTAAVAVIAIMAAGAVLAQTAAESAIKARKAHMALQAFNIGPLAAMAKGEADYDASAAAAAARNLAMLTAMDVARYYPEGTASGEIEGTRALAAIWQTPDDFNAKWQDLGTATAALAESAGAGLDELKSALGPVGQACGGCHKTYRVAD